VRRRDGRQPDEWQVRSPGLAWARLAMRLTVEELTNARDAVAELLEELDLANYLYEIEPDGHSDERWRVRVECETPDGWKMTELRIDRPTLEQSRRPGSAIRSSLLEAWGHRLRR
jgi:hypothetical protein